MHSTTRAQRSYDHRLRELVRSTADIDHATRRGVPRSTARGWLKSQRSEVVTLDVADKDHVELQQEVLALRSRVERLLTVLRLLIVLLKVSRFSLATARVPDGDAKALLLRTIERARAILPLRIALRVLGLSQSRYHSWRREGECGLADAGSCPRTSPQQLTRSEVETIREMVTSDEYRHVPTGTLAMLAQRLGKVFASATTWHRLIRRHKWRRPRRRLYPAKPKVGIRATVPNEIWHVDTSIVRLLDGTRAYLHAIIDNFSRRILAWKVADTFDPVVTAELLVTASKDVVGEQPALLADGGPENFNSAVDDLIETGILRRLLALTDILFSNSLIESWWRALKHQWLYLNSLDTIETLRNLVAFYVEQHNIHLPHSAFRGQTPEEMYFGTGSEVPQELEVARVSARQARMEVNRRTTCPTCETVAS